MIVQPDGDYIPRRLDILIPDQTLRIEVDLLTGKVIGSELLAYAGAEGIYYQEAHGMPFVGEDTPSQLARNLAWWALQHSKDPAVHSTTIEWG